MSDPFDGLDLDERELLVCLALGFVLGVVLIAITRELVSAWVIGTDQAERRRIREELERWWRELPDHDDQDAAELVPDGLTDGSLTRVSSTLKITANTAPNE